MNFWKENWRWIVLPIVVLLIVLAAVIVITNRDGLGPHRYGDLGWLR